MDFENNTPYPARLFRAVIDRQRMTAALVARVTFDGSGADPQALLPSEQQPWIVSPAPWESPVGTMEGDGVFRKAGIDVHVFGVACAPGGVPTGSFDVTIDVAGAVRKRRIFGPRTWVEDRDKLVPSPPAAIATLPLTMEHAFGGEAEIDGLKVPFADNPRGKGFYLGREQASGGPLPQIEDPANEIRTWEDRPAPAGTGFCAFPSGPRMRESVELSDDGPEPHIIALKHRLFNMAFSDLIFESAPPDAVVTLDGIHAEGPISFRLPNLGLAARIALGDRVSERALTVDQILIQGPEPGAPRIARVVLGYRFPFRYHVNPLEIRKTTLFVPEPRS